MRRRIRAIPCRRTLHVIVISGALVLVALVLLVIGLIGPSLGFVYASIGASLAAFAFLVVGILQRRKAEPEVGAGAPASAEELAAVIRTPEQATSDVAVLPAAPIAATAAAAQASGTVLVVQGRPRYHVSGCRYLAGKLAEEVEVDEARAEGFTACGVCKPDAVLAAGPSEVEAAPAASTEEPTEAVTVLEAAPPAPARKAAAKAAAKAPAKAAKAAPAAAAKAPAKAAAAKAAKAPAKAAKPGVVVLPGKDKFHAPTCRFAQGAGATEITRAAATRQGFTACGVCKP
jgi:hypothetical protein